VVAIATRGAWVGRARQHTSLNVNGCDELNNAPTSTLVFLLKNQQQFLLWLQQPLEEPERGGLATH